MKKSDNFPVQSQVAGRRFTVKCDKTNNSEQDKLDGKMNVDITFITPKYPIDDSVLDTLRSKIASSVGIPKDKLNLPDENDGGIGQGSL